MHDSGPSPAIITVKITACGEAGFSAEAVSPDGSAAIADNENPYEAAWNALASVMTQLGYDEPDAR